MSFSMLTVDPAKIRQMGFHHPERVHYQLPPDELVEETLRRGEGRLSQNGALLINTGTFTGRSPKDKFIVRDALTADTVHWNDFNQPIPEASFDQLYRKMMTYLDEREVWVRDGYVCADPRYRLNIRAVNEQPAANLFCYNMFGRPDEETLDTFKPDWTILQAPGFTADPATDGTRQGNFALISFTRRTILIGGTAYTGEIKKGVFSILNYLMPGGQGVLSMHCSANVGEDGDTAIFFGLSGTGKTTLSTDPARRLIGDDEHGWTDTGVFNFEGGCYAKCIDLSEKKEPEIFHAIRDGALVENTVCFPGTDEINFADRSITENTRVSYPLHYIEHLQEKGMAGSPRHIFFLTCDAFGVIPPVSRLSPAQAMYQFISGYTAKVAGTETGVTEPKTTFSACFGAPFLPLHPARYASMLGERIRTSGAKVWLINTGWTGGPYGVGERMPLHFTRAMVKAALGGALDGVPYRTHPLFGMDVPQKCPGVPNALLNPRDTWMNRSAYDEQAVKLAALFVANFAKYADGVSAEIKAAGPQL
ncbi:phosphoenolpyruvate carboxykinase (ATP) [Dinghuibacter silviterrae]|uniref:Phosphoenolpyruvate carboxykinase (ATP) n=1 Tax=Dinghuibacter silviterrae TaxID=1539049 RepID=A0A4R8DRG7_9BACT|nr:phosphoenolpyruvate carboxykinase (ATP) [Dinghuibacter silviterrae]TDX00426.1 phosphoenolpyruvate carboxykinase (ATP) [Dinghuibacter silviterrae]